MGILGTIFYTPVYNLFVFLIDFFTGAVWIAILVTVFIVRLVLLPITLRMSATQEKITKIKPDLEEIKRKYVNDRQTMGMKTMELYKKHNIKPFSSIFMFLFVQIPFFIGMYFIFKSLPEISYEILYFALEPIQEINYMLYNIDLLQRSISLSIAAAVLQYFAFIASLKKTKSNPTEAMIKTMQKVFKFVLPLIALVFSYFLGAAIALYWCAINLFTIVQELIQIGLRKKS